jgi:ElaB/YqjD/DUF883 family membrane-anchored ribosome-binding protein
MKEQHWDESGEDAPTDILEATAALLNDDDDPLLEQSTTPSNKLKVTEMRRRIEERLDSKRLSLEFAYEEFDNWTDRVQ